MGGAHYTFRVSDELLIMKIEEFKRNGGNLSGLVNALLRNYFNGDLNIKEMNKELLELKKLKEEMQEWLEKAKYFESKISEFEELLKERQEKEEIEKNLPLIRKLKEVVFEDIDDLFKPLVIRGKTIERDPAEQIKKRLTTFAAEHRISYPEAVSLFFKAFPDLKERLEGRL